MGLKTKLGVLFIGVNLIIPSISQALILEPIKIDSSQGDPLYAEIPFYQANTQAPLQVSIAQPFEIGIPEATNPSKLAHYNFYVRQNNQGNGVIVITSNQPINDKNLSLLLKINDSGQLHIQQVRKPLPTRIQRLESSLQEQTLQPRIVTDEKALALNLPTTSKMVSEGQALQISNAPPPMLKALPKNVISAPTINTAAQNTISPVIPKPVTSETPVQSNNHVNTSVAPGSQAPLETSTIDNSSNLTISVTRRPANEGVTIPSQITTQQTVQNIQTPVEQPVQGEEAVIPKETMPTTVAQSHKVSANESLWVIASQIARAENLAIQDVMREIHQQNQHAFINGNANRLKQGAVLNIPSEYKTPVRKEPPKQGLSQTEQIARGKPTASQPTVEKQTQAHMSIVSNDSKGSLQGTNKAGQATPDQKNELTIQLQKERQTTLSLQNNVRQLDQQLKQKETRISLLNAKLAELEQQLKSRKLQQQAPTAKSN